jgi:hypothetical protein
MSCLAVIYGKYYLCLSIGVMLTLAGVKTLLANIMITDLYFRDWNRS